MASGSYRPMLKMLLACSVMSAQLVHGTVLMSLEEALPLAFPAATIERETLFLTESQQQRAAELAGGEGPGAVVTRYVATTQAGELAGFAYLDTHRVRTLPETLMIVVGIDGVIRRVEVVVFREPIEYLPRDAWYRQYDGRQLDDELELKRSIRPITGATLTARATTDAVRRILAVHAVVNGEPIE